MTVHSLVAQPTHSRWNRHLEPRLTISPGDSVQFECTEASGGQVRREMTVDEFLAIDRGMIHALTGPVWIVGAEPGDVLEIEVLAIEHNGWGWSSIMEGLGLLKDRFHTPYFFPWKLESDHTSSLAPARVRLRPFLGVMGVASAEDGEFRTRPPGAFGGNMDVRELSRGSRLYLPVLNRGALFSCGDGHAAQGDGEVCINGIEAPLHATLRFRVHKRVPLAGPLIEAPALPQESAAAWVVVESATDAVSAARAATSRMIDLLMNRWGMSAIHAYLLTSVTMKLRLSQVVNEPMFTVSAAIGKDVLPAREMF
jgi:acetamidase/formamidase